MAISDYEVIKEEEDEDLREDEESGTAEYDSEEDPTYEILEETRPNLSKLSTKKSKSRISKKTDSGNEDKLDFFEIKVPELDKSDEKCFEKIQKIIQVGRLEKLKIDQCKVYLRKYGLRLTGKKDVLIERIREHLEVIDGGGEKKYPISSFVFNCKGDACTGDVVMFEQNVYEMYRIASRSSTGPPCGTRIVVGRIVKESYGAAKQQHTFTIEVLWSRGKRPLPPLHPLLIKGRNLYRLKTMRLPWADEDERKKALLEKHSRGHFMRCCRETRIQEKEMRKMPSSKRIKRKEVSGSEGKIDQQREYPVPRSEFLQKNIQQQHQRNMSTSILPNLESQNLVSKGESRSSWLPNPVIVKEQWSRFPFHGQQTTLIQFDEFQRLMDIQEQRHTNVSAIFNKYTQLQGSPPTRRISVAPTESRQHVNAKNHHSTDAGLYHRKPLRSLNGSPPRKPQQLCRFYPQGRCRYGDSCKFLHERREGFA